MSTTPLTIKLLEKKGVVISFNSLNSENIRKIYKLPRLDPFASLRTSEFRNWIYSNRNDNLVTI